MQENLHREKHPERSCKDPVKNLFPGQRLTLKIWIDILRMMAFSGIDLENQ